MRTLLRTAGTEAEQAEASRRASAAATYFHLFRLMHWVLTGSIVLLMLTGLSLHAISRPERSIFSGVLPDFLWSGRVHVWHFCTALIFAPSMIAAAIAARRRAWKRPTHAILLGGGLLMIATGLLMFYAAVWGGPGRAVVWLHSSLGLVLLPVVFLWHGLEGITRRVGALIPAFHPFARPSWKSLLAFLVLAPVGVWLLLACWPLHSETRQLVALSISPQQAARESMSQLPWDIAIPVTAALRNGVGMNGGQTQVTLRALHDGDQLFVLAQWQDPEENRRYTPWKKTEQGWEHLVTNAKDESVFYEDKFALAFPIEPDWRFEQVGCALYCHAGGGNLYGAKNSDRIVDVWHWKATRTDPAGQADDKYWFEPKSADSINGRFGDPKDGGGYQENETAGVPHPAYLPRAMESVQCGAILGGQKVEYTEELASRISLGAIVPGMICSPFQGDRGDVNCESQHRNGRWTLYFRRKLDTKSDYDVVFRPGGSYPFALAAFDHTSKRHAYSFSVFHLVVCP